MAKLDIFIRAKNNATGVLGGMEGQLKNLQAQGERVGESFAQMGEKMRGLGTGLTAGLTLPIVGFFGAAIKGAAEMEQLEVAFTTMLGSAEKAKELIGELSTFSALTPFEMPEVINAGKQLLAFGIAADDVQPTLRQLGDIASGLNIPLGDMAYLFGTSRAQGRLFAADINQFTSRGVPIIAALAATMGVAENKIKGMVEAGKIGFPELQAALDHLTEEGSQFGGMMEKQSRTLSGLFSTLKDNIGQSLSAIGQAIVKNLNLNEVLAGWIEQMGKIKDAIVSFTETQPEITKWIIVIAGATAVIGPLLIGVGMLASAIGAAIPIIMALGGAFSLLLGPVGLVIGAVGLLAIAWRKDFLGMRGAITRMTAPIRDFLSNTNAMRTTVQRISSAIANIKDSFGKFGEGAASAATALKNFIQTGDSAGLSAIYDRIRAAISKIDPPTFSELWDAAKLQIRTVIHDVEWKVPVEKFIELRDAVSTAISSIAWGELGFNALVSVLVGATNMRNAISELVAKVDWGAIPAEVISTLNTGREWLRDVIAGIVAAVDWAAIPAEVISTLNSGRKWLRDVIAGIVAAVDWAAIPAEVISTLNSGRKWLRDVIAGIVAAVDWGAIPAEVISTLNSGRKWLRDVIAGIVAAVDWAAIPAETLSILRAGGKAIRDTIAGIVAAVDWARMGEITISNLKRGGEAIRDAIMSAVSGVDWATLSGEALISFQSKATSLRKLILGALTDFEWNIDTSKTAALKKALDAVRPLINQIFGENGIVLMISDAIDDSLTAFGEKLANTDTTAMSKIFNQILGGVVVVASNIANANLEVIAERTKSLISVATDITNFVANFGKGIDLAAVTAALAGFAGNFSAQLKTVLGDKEMLDLGGAIGNLANTIITKLGEALSGGTGENLGEAVGETISTLTIAAFNLVQGLAGELAKVDWVKFSSQVGEFIVGFLGGLAAGLIGADFSEVINPIKEKFKEILDIFQKPQEAAPGGIGLPAHLLNNQQKGEDFWAKIVPPLNWATFIPATLAWATFVPDILYWHNFITETLGWKTFIPDVLAWKTFIPFDLNWRTFVPNDIQWSDFVPDLNWEDFWNFFTGDETTSTSATTGNSAEAGSRSGLGFRAFEPALAFAGAAPGGDMINIHINAQIANDIDMNQLAYRIADVLRRRRL